MCKTRDPCSLDYCSFCVERYQVVSLLVFCIIQIVLLYYLPTSRYAYVQYNACYMCRDVVMCILGHAAWYFTLHTIVLLRRWEVLMSICSRYRSTSLESAVCLLADGALLLSSSLIDYSVISVPATCLNLLTLAWVLPHDLYQSLSINLVPPLVL